MKLDSLRQHWFVACACDEVPKNRPVARTVCELPVVLFREASGRIAALADRCPHRNAPLSGGRTVDGCLQCPYHGWAFDGAGACRRVPGLPGDEGCQVRAAKIASHEHDGFVWVCVGENPMTFSPPPILASDRRWDRLRWAADAECDLVDGMENLLDACHPHFAHAGLLRSGAKRRPVHVTIRRSEAQAEAIYTEESRPAGWIPRLLEGQRVSSIGRYFPACTAQLEYRGPQGPKFVLTSMFTPAQSGWVKVHSVIATPAGKIPAFIKNRILRVLFSRVLRQDQAVLREQSRNIARFGGPSFASTPLDVMRPHILFFLREEAATRTAAFEAGIQMEL